MASPASNPARSSNQITGNLAFVREVAKYFMDFLETDFHKRKNPKRSIRLRNSDNLLTGLNVAKYPSFEREIYGLVNESFEKGTISITRGVYRTSLPKNLLDLIKLQVSKIKVGEVAEAVGTIADEIEKVATLHKAEHDKAISAAFEASGATLKAKLVLPFVRSIEKPIESLGMGDENDVYLIEEELTEVLSKLGENKVSEIVNRVIAGEKANIPKELKMVFETDVIKASISTYFENLQVGDLFAEVFEIAKNKAILDKQEFYLYLGEVTFNKSKYPIFYVPFSAEQAGDSYALTFDSQIYINKRALEFIVQEYNVQKGTRGTLKTITDRIIYLSHHKENLAETLNAILGEICNLFELDRQIDLTKPSPQTARSLLVRATNTVHVALFDKSDEALINDYEEILQQLNSGGGELSGIFDALIDDFINKNPTSFNPEVEDEWDNSEIPDKLVSGSPIPLNSEQLQILSSIRKPGCKYIIVEGPPGTGKSHTITAISFDAILNHKSVLILSDKKEALDVVEDKITETMNKVRHGEEEFQNPILRLGKIGSTYNKIFARGTLERIKAHQRVVKKGFDQLNESIEKEQNSLKEDIEAEILTYGNIAVSEIHDYHDVAAAYENQPFPFDRDEIAQNPKLIESVEALRALLLGLTKQFSESQTAKLLGIIPSEYPTPDEFKLALLEVMALSEKVAGVRTRLGKKVDAAIAFRSFSDSALPTLKGFSDRYKAGKLPVLGYLFSRAKIAQIDAEFKVAFPLATFDRPSARLSELAEAIETFDHLLALRALGQGLVPEIADCLNRSIEYIAHSAEITAFSEHARQLGQQIGKTQGDIARFPKTCQLLQIVPTRFDTWLSNKLLAMSDADFERARALITLNESLEGSFNAIPRVDYARKKKQIETLVTTKVTHLLDTRLVEFYTNNQNDAAALRDIIKEKRRFPKEQFAKLKDAFPCILAGIRDYAEFIPLEPGIFDLVIIDEASQVSIAQAFPALIRAKKVLILGDRKQFSNVKSAQARSETNTDYKNSLEEVFRREVSKDESKLVKLRKFDIKTSILEFFESINNYSIQLQKHFRGYRELIAYSNRNFYLDSLQVMKIRGKSIDDVIQFTDVEPNPLEPIQNTNRKEVDAIISELHILAVLPEKPSVGIITPHTNQQKLLMEEISKLSIKDALFDDLKLKIMTFDTCQGEERDVILYSMVASEHSDKLWGVFIKSFASVDAEEDGKIKIQRLNVGFSRAKECVHFFISKPLDKFEGSIGEALRFFHTAREDSKKEKTAAEVDARSKMEPEVLSWFYQTKFWISKKERIEFMPQFEIGKYLRQLDQTYQHPSYKVDFLVVYVDESHREHKIIIEYDGFAEHFKDADGVNAFNYQHYYSEDDLYRQKVLESYGYKFIRINRFNAGKNPVTTLDNRIVALVSEASASNPFLDGVHATIEGIENGDKKECPRCREIRDIEEFRDLSLISGLGRICRPCKAAAPEKEIVPKPREAVAGITCPRCSSSMIPRTGRYGRFYGCVKYPSCKGTRTTTGGTQSSRMT